MNDLVGSLQRLNCNFALLTASTTALIPPAEVPQMKMLVLGGEAIAPALIEKWLLGSNATLANSYGPTECSITTTINFGVTDETGSSIIGRPIRGTQNWIVDTHNYNRLVPIGAVGELLIEGPQVARGYRNDPVKTSAAFITDPGFTADVGPRKSGRRMYRSGDLVRYNADGNITILGRSDSQIKIRGQRVDLGEIESCIVKLVPKVRTAVVEYLHISDNQHALVAAVEFLDNDNDDDVAGYSAWLKKSLAKRLPAYMVPRLYLQIDKIPKNASGKIDRKAVRQFMMGEGNQIADAKSRSASKTGKVDTDREAVVRKLWAAVLGVEAETIDRRDNFFDIGGDSISAMKVVATARAETLDLHVLDIFENPVLFKMAVVAKSLTRSALEATSPCLYRPFQLLDDVDNNNIDAFLDEIICPITGTGKESIQDVFPTTDAVAFSVAGALTAAQTEVNTFILDTDRGLDLVRLQQSCMLLAQHIEAFRTAFAFDIRNGRLLQIILKSYQHNVLVVKAAGSLEDATESLYEGHMCRQPLRLGTPMVNMAILQQDESKKTRILLRMSHAIYDAMSLPIILDTLRKLYHQPDDYEPLLSGSFAHYVADLNRQTSDTSYSYWRSLLDGSTMPELIPATEFDHHQSPLRMAFTKNKVISVPKSKGEGITTSTLISCAWAHVLAQYTGKNDVVFGDTISGRNVVDPSISSIVVGCCATNVPMRIRFADSSGQHSIHQLLNQVRDQQRNRIPHEGVGFRSMIRECTEWSPATRLTSVVNHRPAKPASKSASGQIDFQVSTITTEMKPLTTWYDLAVISQENDGTVEMSLGYSTRAFHPDTAQALLEDLADTVHILLNAGPSKSDQIALLGTEMMPRSSFNFASLRPVRSSKEQSPSQRKSSNAISTNKLNDSSLSILDTIWFSVFTSKRTTSVGTLPPDAPTPDMCYLPFYQLGGDLLDAAHLIAIIQRRIKTTPDAEVNGDAISISHAQVTIDDVLHHPSLMGFASVLNQKQLHLI